MNIIFKQHLKVFLKDELKLNDRRIGQIDQCKDNEDLREWFVNNGERIAEALEVDLNEDCDECDKNECKIETLETEAEALEAEIEEMPGNFKTLDEERKFEAFMEYHHKYNATQMDQLLK